MRTECKLLNVKFFKNLNPEVLTQNIKVITMFTTRQKKFKLNHDYMKKNHAEVEIFSNGQNLTEIHHCALD